MAKREKIEKIECECCDVVQTHEELIQKVEGHLPDEQKVLSMSQSAISHQLRILKQMKLVKNRREGKTVFYSLADDHILTIISQGMEHVEE